MQFVPPFDLEDITGIQERRVRSKEEDSFTIALAVAQDALKKSRYQPLEKAIHFDISNACAGMMSGKNGI